MQLLMKKYPKSGAVIAALALLLLFSACSEVPAEQTETVSETAAAASETTIETTATVTTKTETTTTATDTANTETIPQDAENVYVQVSPDNEFIDFEFIEDYQGTTEIGDLADKAVEYLSNEFTVKTTQWEFLYPNVPDTIPDKFADYTGSSGNIVPKFQTAYPNDYDGDGRVETFIVLNAPRFEYDVMQSYLVFADSGGNMELVDSFCREFSVQFLNYGRDKQIIFGGEGEFGPENHRTLFGVKSGKAVVYYRLRGAFQKENCFLASFGWQACGALMYYDTVTHEYRVIMSTDIDIEDIEAMDKTGVFKEYYGEDSPFAAFRLIGGKYYCLIKQKMMDWGEPYIYENGEFIKLENSCIRVSYDMDGLSGVIDIDMDKAVSEMKKPIEPFVQVSPDNEFIDFEFIEDYQGTTEIGDLADKAVSFMKESEQYKRSADSVESFTLEGMLKNPDVTYTLDQAERHSAEFSEYISDGVIEPKIAAAYPNDYDGDGSIETFLIIKMPYSPPSLRDGLVTVRDFVIFADKDGNMEILDETCAMYPVQLLNYGKFKQIAIGGGGMAGVEDHIILYGVIDGKATALYMGRGGFAKEDCFLSFFGWQGSGHFMYYDTAANEYIGIEGVPVSEETVRAMDADNVFKNYYSETGNAPPEPFKLVGGKYYLAVMGMMDWGSVYVYEDGKFVYLPDSIVRTNSDSYAEIRTVTDIDIEQAVASMKPVQK